MNVIQNKFRLIVAILLFAAFLIIAGGSWYYLKNVKTKAVKTNPILALGVTDEILQSRIAECEKSKDQNSGSCYTKLFELFNDTVADDDKAVYIMSEWGEYNLSECEKIGNQDSKDSCYGTWVSFAQESYICDKISSSRAKDLCYENVGVRKKDLTICARIKDEMTKNSCYSKVGAANGDVEICNMVVNYKNNNDRDNCYAAAAYMQKDSSICELLNYDKRNCYISVAIARQDPDMCLGDAYCFMKVGISKKDIAICNMIEENDYFDKENRDYCVGVIRGDLTICDKAGLLGKDSCYMDIAIATQNSEICNKTELYKKKMF